MSIACAMCIMHKLLVARYYWAVRLVKKKCQCDEASLALNWIVDPFLKAKDVTREINLTIDSIVIYL